MPNQAYTAGDRVRVIDGPLANFEAEVREVTAAHLKVDVELKGRPVPIDVYPHRIEPLS